MEEGPRTAPTLLVLTGAPAVGKLAVANEIADLTGFKVFHNHLSIEAVLPIFDFGHPSFVRLVEEFRAMVFEEVAMSELDGLIFTYVWAFERADDQTTIHRYVRPFAEQGAIIRYVELRASLESRLERNEHPLRLAAKPSKRDVPLSRRRLLEHEERHRFTSDGDMAGRDDWLVIDNTDLAPRVVAERVIDQFGLVSKSQRN